MISIYKIFINYNKYKFKLNYILSNIKFKKMPDKDSIELIRKELIDLYLEMKIRKNKEVR